MTWGEFKAAVEKLGVKDHEEIRYIGTTGNDLPEAVAIERRPDGAGRMKVSIE